ncbi:MAG: nicotinamide-nucleotide amidohydrolase family protein [Actinobacteria bacterium]|nr:nicotinamide-nucleotide amidohydrolase family protein [Actinomycetota bacterium]
MVDRTAVEVIRLATGHGLRVAVAESLTGGLLAGELVSVPGASLAFSGGVVAYDTSLKRSLLGVDAELLARRGPVDAEVAMQMAAGVRRACAVPRDPRGLDEPAAADIGLATTGVAGPDPDPQTGQPAGTVWLGISSARGDRAVELRLSGDRAQIRAATVSAALTLLCGELSGDS